MHDPRTAASWALAPHTGAKLAILGAYLRAWFQILSQGGFDRVIYIDGFAGPGRYSGGEDGSRIVALKALESQAKLANTAFEFHFVEHKRRVADALKANIAELNDHGRIAPNTTIHVHERKTFEQAYKETIGPRPLNLVVVVKMQRPSSEGGWANPQSRGDRPGACFGWHRGPGGGGHGGR